MKVTRAAGGEVDAAEEVMSSRASSRSSQEDAMRTLAFAQAIVTSHKEMHTARRLLLNRGHTASVGQLLRFFYGAFYGTKEHGMLKEALRDKKTRGGTLEEEPTNDGSDDFCAMCGGQGLLVCCETCPEVYHPQCLGMEDVPEDDFWQCPNCTGRAGASPPSAAALSALSINELKEKMRSMGLSLFGCLDKQDLIDALLKRPAVTTSRSPAEHLEGTGSSYSSVRPNLMQPQKGPVHPQTEQDCSLDGGKRMRTHAPVSNSSATASNNSSTVSNGTPAALGPGSTHALDAAVKAVGDTTSEHAAGSKGRGDAPPIITQDVHSKTELRAAPSSNSRSDDAAQNHTAKGATAANHAGKGATAANHMGKGATLTNHTGKAASSANHAATASNHTGKAVAPANHTGKGATTANHAGKGASHTVKEAAPAKYAGKGVPSASHSGNMTAANHIGNGATTANCTGNGAVAASHTWKGSTTSTHADTGAAACIHKNGRADPIHARANAEPNQAGASSEPTQGRARAEPTQAVAYAEPAQAVAGATSFKERREGGAASRSEGGAGALAQERMEPDMASLTFCTATGQRYAVDPQTGVSYWLPPQFGLSPGQTQAGSELTLSLKARTAPNTRTALFSADVPGAGTKSGSAGSKRKWTSGEEVSHP